MKVSKSSGSGAWLDKEKLQPGDVIKLITEAELVEGQNGTQLVAKCRVKGWDGEAVNVAINTPSKNALIDAFGDDTKNWIGQYLTAHPIEGVFGGKAGIALYLLPEGFERAKDAGGYIVIQRKQEARASENRPSVVRPPEEEVNPEDIPF